MKLIKLFLISILPSSSLTATPVEEGFVSLFNGKDLTGWTPMHGTAPFVARDGQIIGTTAKGSPNTFLTTDKHYSDFELRFDVKIDDDKLNSGCQIRSNSSEDYKKGMVFGYQVELEVEHGTAGFIYDEGRRRWLSKNRVDEAKNKAFKSGEWNQIRIRCQGASIKTWVNDVAIADLTDNVTSSGFIGLQVHSVKGDPKWSVRWKNIRIKELPSASKALYNGKNLTKNLIKNPSFEQGAKGDHWVAEDGVFERHHSSILKVDCKHGQHYAELASAKGYKLTQTVNVEKGKEYELKFYSQARPRAKQKESLFILKVDGKQVKQILPEFEIWTEYKFTIKATSNTMKISFEDQHVGSAGIGAMVDQVSITKK